MATSSYFAGVIASCRGTDGWRGAAEESKCHYTKNDALCSTTSFFCNCLPVPTN